ncbi:MAG: hypothetical protein ACI4S9_02830 [Christensenellales bacterium]
MKFTNEMLEEAKTAKSVEELLEMANAEHIELTAEEAAKAFAELNKTGELSDEELDNVAGGCSSYSPSGNARSRDEVVFLYEVGQIVEIHNTPFGTTKTARIICKFVRYSNSWYYPYYGVEYLSGGSEEISQSLVEIR